MIAVVGLSHKNAPIGVRERLALLARRRCPSVLAKLTRGRRDRRGGRPLHLQPGRGLRRRPRPRREPGRAGRGGARRGARCSQGIGGDHVVPYLSSVVGQRRGARTSSASPPRSTRSSSASRRSSASSRTRSRSPASTGPSAPRWATRCTAPSASASACAPRPRSARGRSPCPSVAVDLARQIFGELDGRTAALVGAGEMAEAAAKLLVKRGRAAAHRQPEPRARQRPRPGGRRRAAHVGRSSSAPSSRRTS